ncbi:nucleolar protein dao-5-like isoform X2 [Dreissena polymorpha]|uniref:Endonuclease/exonuclease/phosphatase domain-containing protein n=1 Tax=Dreissena polymorpha TaxID=45954 RepID=A0A9D4D6V4_DREPO|nr:nucleolar protein dao-5-like isoform X2 [Dreissena polymorpha]KAH3739787.1 hypothetical protein DPMN_046475 [Dreissena polymorpha]
MPAKRKASANKGDDKSSPTATSRRLGRSASAASSAAVEVDNNKKRKASSSPAPAKKGRQQSPSPAPVSRQPSRGRAAVAKKPEVEEKKPTGRSKSNKKEEGVKVTKPVVQEAEEKKAQSKGRSRSRSSTASTPSTPKNKASTPKQAATPKQASTPKQKAQTPKTKSQTPKQKTQTPKQATQTPKQKAQTSKQRSETPKQAAITPKQKSAPRGKSATPKQADTPKSQGSAKKAAAANPKRSPVAKMSTTPTPKRSPVAKMSTTPKKSEQKAKVTPASSKGRSSRSRRGKDDTQNESENKNEPSEEGPSEEKPDEKEQGEVIPNEKNSDEDIKIEETKPEEISDEKKHNEEEPNKKTHDEEEPNDKTYDAEELNDKTHDEEEPNDITQDEEEPNDKTHDAEEHNDKTHDEEEPNDKTNDEEEPYDKTHDKEGPNEEPHDEEMHNEKTHEKEISNEEAHEEVIADEKTPDEETPNAVTQDKEKPDEKKHDDPNKEIPNEKTNVTADTDKELMETSATEENSEEDNQKSGEDVDENDNGKSDVVDLNEDSGDALIIGEERPEVVDLEAMEDGAGDGQIKDKEVVSNDVEEISDDDVQEIKLGRNESAVPISHDELSGVSDSSHKRKVEAIDDDCLDAPSESKKAKVEEIAENGDVESVDEVVKEYVVIEMEDVPSADSEEVQKSVPHTSETVNPIFNRVFVPNPSFAGSSDKSSHFSLASYNILADCHLLRNDYSFTEEKYLKPEHRLAAIVEELKYLDSDIICMQEVDPTFYREHLTSTLTQLGYEGFYKKRTDDYFVEGEATFFKTSRFTLVDSSLCRLADLVNKELTDEIDPDIRTAVQAYMDLPDVCVITTLKCNNTGKSVTVGNVHINWGRMKTPDIQCVQIASAIKEIVSQSSGDAFPHIICGDFNSPPLSAGYLVARDGYPSGDETINRLMAIEGLELPDGKKASLVNSLWPAFQHTSSSLKSAYMEAQGSEPEITSYNRGMCECVDYIFYSSTSLDNVGVYSVAARERIMSTGGTPDQHFPSDHVSIKAVLAFKM